MVHLQTPAIIRFASLPTSRWRNDGGSTTQMIVAGDDSAFDWRLSLAEIDRAGTFSTFPGTARVLTVVQGQGLILTIDGTEHRLEQHQPFHFSGHASTEAALPSGPVRALNVMTRQGAVRAEVAVLELVEGLGHQLTADQIAVLVSGHAVVADGGATTQLSMYDTLWGVRQEGLSIHGRGFLALISFETPAQDSNPSGAGHHAAEAT